MTKADPPDPLRIFIVAGEHSGDALGGRLMAALAAMSDRPIDFAGVGGHAMAQGGLTSLYPLSDIAVMGPAAILKVLPRLIARVRETAAAALAFDPHVCVVIDAPEFTHPVAKRIRKLRPDIPIIDYVSPSVWAWRPGRARRMRRYIDHVAALLPFEPDAHRRLGGPPCTYVGHPLIERQAEFAAVDAESLRARLGLASGKPVLVVLPGSRLSEVERLMQPFGEAIGLLASRGMTPEVVVPVVGHVRALVEREAAVWPSAPHFVTAETDKLAAFKLARAALAASGTVTLELGLLGTPMVVGYKVDALAAAFRFLLKTPTIVLANLVLGQMAVPEFKQEECTGPKLADALAPLLADTATRATQVAALARIPGCLEMGSTPPSERAAAIVLAAAGC